MLEENARKLFLNQRKNKNVEPQQNEPKMIVLKNLEGNKKKSKEDTTTLDSNLLIETLNNITISLLERDDNKELEDQLPPLEKNEILFIHIMQFTYEYPAEFVHKLISSLNKNHLDIKDGLLNSYTDYKSFMTLMI